MRRVLKIFAAGLAVSAGAASSALGGVDGFDQDEAENKRDE